MTRPLGLIAVVFAVAASSLARADVPAPGRRTSGRVVVPVVVRRGAIRGESNNVQAKVIIPRYLLDGALETYREAQIKPTAKDEAAAAAPDAPAGAPPAPAAPAATAPPKSEARATPPLGTIIAGLAMSLAAASLVFVVRGNRAAKTTAVVLLGGCVLACAYAVGRADVVPSGRPNGPSIVIQFVDDANEVTLLLTR